MNRVWQGTTDLCFKKDVQTLTSAENGCSDGEQIQGLSKTNMIGTEGVIICGKRGGPSFIEMKRVNPITLTCPRGFIPCSTETKATETVCLTPEQVPAECPIIDLVLVSDADLLGWDYVGYTVFDPPMGNSGLKIAVTKDKFRNYISGGAIMGIEVNT